MNTKSFLFLTCAASALAAPAAGQDTQSWQGAYGGLGATVSVTGIVHEFGSDYDLTDSAAYPAEVFLGYNWMRGNLLYGVELSHGPQKIQADGWPNYFFKNLTDLRLKAGYAKDRWAIYLTAGGSIGDYDYSGDIYGVRGWSLGVGVSYLLTENIFAGAGIQHRDLDRYSGPGGKKKGSSALSGEFNTLSVRVGFLF